MFYPFHALGQFFFFNVLLVLYTDHRYPLSDVDLCQAAHRISWFVFWCGHLQRQQWVYYVTALVDALSYTLDVIDHHSPCLELRFFTPHKNDLTRPASCGDRPPKSKRHPRWLAHAVMGVFCPNGKLAYGVHIASLQRGRL